MNIFKEAVDGMHHFFKNNKDIDIKKNVFVNPVTSDRKSIFNKTEFYSSYESASMEWSLMNADENDLRITGSLNMLPEKEIMKDWEGIIYFESTLPDSNLRLFKPVDFFSDDACVGFFVNDERFIMHLFNYEGNPQSLGVTVDDYVLLAFNCRCFYFWQYLLNSFICGTENEVVRDYIDFSSKYHNVIDIDEIKQIFNQKRVL